MFKKIIFLFFITSIFGSVSLYSELHGKVDIGPTFINIDVLQSGKTIETLHMKGAKGDATLFLYKGFCIKPGFIWAEGHGKLVAGSVGVGFYFPVIKCLKILPNVGVSWSYLRTTVDYEQLNLFDLKERFRSCSPFIGMEFCLSITDKLTLIGSYQYAWCRTHTKIKPIVSEKSHSCGPNYTLGLDYSINQNWSIVGGVGYNITLSHEKHGLRGKGAKVGIAYYF